MIYTSLEDDPLPLKQPVIGNGRHTSAQQERCSRSLRFILIGCVKLDHALYSIKVPFNCVGVSVRNG